MQAVKAQEKGITQLIPETYEAEMPVKRTEQRGGSSSALSCSWEREIMTDHIQKFAQKGECMRTHSFEKQMEPEMIVFQSCVPAFIYQL